MDTNMVVPTGPTTSKVIYDYFLEEDFLEGMTNQVHVLPSYSRYQLW